MAFRTWGRLLLTALGVSVLAGAGQLGIAYGFGVVRLDGAFVDASVNRWPAQLAWVGWFAAVATVAGAVLTERFARRDEVPAGTTELLSIAGVSALGAIVVAPLCMQPARAAELGGSVDPVWAAGICAALGAVVGAGAAITVLLKPPFGWGVAGTAGIVWLLALLSVAPTIVANRPLATVRLGVLEPSWLDPAAAQRLAMLLLPVLALLAGGAVGVLARRAGHPPLVGGAAGAAGPVLVAFAYLTAGPGTATDRYQLAPYYGALIAVVAGALGSTATTVLPRPIGAAGDAVEPTDILAPLPPTATGAAPATGTTVAATGAAASPAAPGGPAPAHWDWPETGGAAGASPGPRHVAPEQPTVPGPPTAPGQPDDEDHARTRAVSGLLSPGRRTSAIDVLAAGRPGPQPSAGPDPDDTPPRPRTDAAAEPAPLTEPAPVTEPAPAVAGTATAGSAAADAPTATGGATASTTGAVGPEPEPRTDPAASAPRPAETPSAPARGARARRGRAAERSTDDRTPTGDSPVAGSDTPEPVTAPDATRSPTRDAAVPAVDAAVPGDEGTGRPTRSRRTRAARTSRSDAAPVSATTPPAGDVPPAGPIAAATASAPRDTADPTPPGPTPTDPAPTASAPAATGTPADPAPAATEKPGGAATPGDADMPIAPPAAESPVEPKLARARSFFFDDAEPAGPPAAPPSPRPRFPIFEDVAERPGEVRPAWPIASRPPRPDSATGPSGPAIGRDGDDRAARAEPAPRPRHQGLPEPGRSTGWDALATNAKPAGPTAPEPPRTAAAETTVPAQAGPGPDGAEPDPTGERGRHAGPEDADAVGGKTRARRGLFRRNRAKGEPEPADRTVEPDATTDDEYVDWVAGLASDDNADDTRSLRTGRHHRD
ncbi:hypothetical protein COO58_27670 [Micromonospora sp. WMMA1996]|uniref:hypothetical protein n=1 Tax=Micromonospora sp. WMMA1996 TaxID=2039878 RepID=UPI000BF49992|nr:hypothetical protein [Micromonospora sp. WMMA1996]PGH41581.1 hypothetical protein COO58_27670 [Micromonospora sp. WMMA1996]